MALHLSSPASDLPGIGAGALKDLKTLGIANVRDLLFAVPFRYDDYSNVQPVARVRVGIPATVTGTITQIKARPSKTTRRKIVEAVLEDATGELPIIWFNQEYLVNTIRPGTHLSLAGMRDFRYKRAMVNPVHEPPGRNVLTGRIVPVYRLSGSLKMHRMRTAMAAALGAVGELEDPLPQSIRDVQNLCSLQDAVRAIHFPNSIPERDRAIERLKFDELFLHQLLFARSRVDRQRRATHTIDAHSDAIKTFLATLPFTLTSAQKRAAWEIVQDMAQPHPMNRLLQGDVGSGKTVVAAIASLCVFTQGKTVVYLAPTELLCAQQQSVLCSWFPEISIGLLTRSQQKINQEDVKKDVLVERMRTGDLRFVVGTHALLQQELVLDDLALVVIDEQHRFGVAQRRALFATSQDKAPHLLSMTATPIPRSLALTVFGDLDVSTINQMPEGRKRVGTALVSDLQRDQMWDHVRAQVQQGRQVFVVCPLIDPSDALGAKSVTEATSQLSKGPLKGCVIEQLHGRLKADTRQDLITKFAQGKIDVLVSTTVVEVGVDIPHATVMVILGAERFGLAQLHQLRGRVGRSDLASYCYLLPDNETPQAHARLHLLETTHDGFELAKADLQLRGAGNLFGTAQSGFPDFKLATEADGALMQQAHACAAELLQTDPALGEHPLLAAQVGESFEAVHLE